MLSRATTPVFTLPVRQTCTYIFVVSTPDVVGSELRLLRRNTALSGNTVQM